MTEAGNLWPFIYAMPCSYSLAEKEHQTFQTTRKWDWDNKWYGFMNQGLDSHADKYNPNLSTHGKEGLRHILQNGGA